MRVFIVNAITISQTAQVSDSRHVLKPGLDCGLWTVDYGLWTMDCGLWTVDYGLWTMDCGLWTVDYGLWTMDCGLWTVDCGLCRSFE